MLSLSRQTLSRAELAVAYALVLLAVAVVRLFTRTGRGEPAPA